MINGGSPEWLKADPGIGLVYGELSTTISLRESKAAGEWRKKNTALF